MNTNAEEILNLNPGGVPAAPITARVQSLTVKVKKITTTNEGTLQVVLESEGMDNDALDQVKDMLELQQAALVKVAMEPVQQDLFDA